MVITLCFHLETIKGTRFSQLVVFLFSFTRIIYSSSPSDCESGELARGDCYTGSRGWFGGSSGMPSAGEDDSVTGTLKHVKSSVARTGGIVLRWSSGYGAGG